MKKNGKGVAGSEIDPVNDMPVGLIIVESEGRIIDINRRMMELIGLKENDLKGMLLFDMIDPADLTEMVSILKGRDRMGNERINISFRSEDGKTTPLEGTFSWTGKEEERHLICCFDDPGEKDDPGALYRRVMEDLPFPVIVMNKRLEPVFQNSAADEQINLVARRPDPINNPKKELKDALVKALSEGKGGSVDVPVPLKDGVRYFEVIIAPLHHNGHSEQVMEIWMDAQPPEPFSSKDTCSNGLSDELITTSNAVIIVIDLEGRIRLFNNGAKRTLGYDPRDVEGKVWFDYLVDEEAEGGRLEIFQWNIKSGFRTQYESRVRAESGQTITLLLENTVIFDRQGEVSMVLMVGQDVTRTKNLERSLREQTEKLADAMDEINLYNDLMIHDIHNANAGILGYLELLKMEGIPESNKESYLESALSEVRKSSAIIKDVKIMSRSKPGSRFLPIDLDEAIGSSISKIRDMKMEKKVIIDWEGTDIHVMADDVLDEAFLRILERCVENSQGTDLRIEIDVSRDPSKMNIIPQPVHVTFRDNGGGMSEQMMKDLLQKPSSTELGSQALGLFLVNNMISNYNGLLWLERIDEGTEVHILLSEAV